MLILFDNNDKLVKFVKKIAAFTSLNNKSNNKEQQRMTQQRITEKKPINNRVKHKISQMKHITCNI